MSEGVRPARVGQKWEQEPRETEILGFWNFYDSLEGEEGGMEGGGG